MQAPPGPYDDKITPIAIMAFHSNEFSKALSKVMHSMSKNDVRFYLDGVYFELLNNETHLSC